jgi:HSP20 family molecular chaperone IbpA
MDEYRAEFRDGTFHRTVALPIDAKQKSISAIYTDGNLKIMMTSMSRAAAAVRFSSRSPMRSPSRSRRASQEPARLGNGGSS